MNHWRHNNNNNNGNSNNSERGQGKGLRRYFHNMNCKEIAKEKIRNNVPGWIFLSKALWSRKQLDFYSKVNIRTVCVSQSEVKLRSWGRRRKKRKRHCTGQWILASSTALKSGFEEWLRMTGMPNVTFINDMLQAEGWSRPGPNWKSAGA